MIENGKDQIEESEKLPEGRKSNENELVEVDKHITTRPTRGSLVRIKKINGDERIGKVKQPEQ